MQQQLVRSEAEQASVEADELGPPPVWELKYGWPVLKPPVRERVPEGRKRGRPRAKWQAAESALAGLRPLPEQEHMPGLACTPKAGDRLEAAAAVGDRQALQSAAVAAVG